MSLKILVAHPGADSSTGDLHRAMCKALEARGHTLWQYALNARISVAGMYLHYAWRKGGKQCERPTPSDVLYKASEELLARALRVQPDVVLVVSAMYLHPDIFVLMKRAGLRVAVLFTESPYDNERQLTQVVPWVDLAWTNERSNAGDITWTDAQGQPRTLSVKYLPHGYDPDIHNTSDVSSQVPSHDVCFVGTGFQERIDLLSEIDWEAEGIKLGLYGTWNLVGSRNRLRPFIQGPIIENDVAVKLYKRAKINLNLYRTSKGFGKDAPRITEAESLNPRAYELAASGAFSLSTPRAEVTEMFGPLVPTFQNSGELLALIKAWLADDIGRERVWQHLPAAVAGHTWHHRVRQMEADLASVGIVASAQRREAEVGKSSVVVGSLHPHRHTGTVANASAASGVDVGHGSSSAPFHPVTP